MGRVYEYETEGKWIQPVRRGYRIACCDCGLVHQMDFRVRKRRVQFRVFQDNRATGQVRRHMKRKLQGVWERIKNG